MTTGDRVTVTLSQRDVETLIDAAAIGVAYMQSKADLAPHSYRYERVLVEAAEQVPGHNLSLVEGLVNFYRKMLPSEKVVSA